MPRKHNSKDDHVSAVEAALPSIQASIGSLLTRTRALESIILRLDPASLPDIALPAVAELIGVPNILRGLFGSAFSPLLLATFESTAAEAGAALSRIQDLVGWYKRRADRLEEVTEGPTVGDSRLNLDQQKAELESMRDVLTFGLSRARDAKAKVSAAALAGKKFGAAKPHIEGAQESFDDADDDLDTVTRELSGWEGGADRPQTDRDKGRADRARGKIQNAADKLKDDVAKLKDAAAAIT